MESCLLLADRTRAFDSSGIRKVFDLAAKMKDPINFSIGQPDFDVPEPVKDACIDAIRAGKNAYTVTQGLPVAPRQAASTHRPAVSATPTAKCSSRCGTSGGLSLVMWSLINPGDEVLMFDPYFVMYPAPDEAGRRRAGDHRHLSRFPHRPEQSRRRHHAADEAHPAQQPGQSDRRRGNAKPKFAGWQNWPPSRT